MGIFSLSNLPTQFDVGGHLGNLYYCDRPDRWCVSICFEYKKDWIYISDIIDIDYNERARLMIKMQDKVNLIGQDFKNYFNKLWC